MSFHSHSSSWGISSVLFPSCHTLGPQGQTLKWSFKYRVFINKCPWRLTPVKGKETHAWDDGRQHQLTLCGCWGLKWPNARLLYSLLHLSLVVGTLIRPLSASEATQEGAGGPPGSRGKVSFIRRSVGRQHCVCQAPLGLLRFLPR